MYRGEMALPGATELVPTLQALGIRHAFVTNNATLTPGDVAKKLQQMAVPASPGDIVTSAEAAAAYLQKVAPVGASVYVIGEEGLQQAIDRAGFAIDEKHPSFVVVGLDRHVTYERLAMACAALRGGAGFVATNADPAYPVEDTWWPGAGALLAALTTATGIAPIIIGKPQPTLLQVALERLEVSADHAAMAGDQVGTDVRAGHAAGMTTILVGEEVAAADPTAPQPDLRVANLADLLVQLRQARGRVYS